MIFSLLLVRLLLQDRNVCRMRVCHLFGVTKSQNVDKKQKVKCLIVSYSTFQHNNFLILGKIQDGDQDGGYLGCRHRHPAVLQPKTYIRLVEHITGFLLKVKSLPEEINRS